MPIDMPPDTEHTTVLQYLTEPGDPKVAEANRKKVMSALEGITAGNHFDQWWDMFHPDATFHEAGCLPYGGAHKGIENIKKAFSQVPALYKKMHTVFEQILAQGDIVILYQVINFTVRSNGNTGTLPVSEIMRFKDGKVIEWRACYFDANFVCKQLGAC
jgi:hypothetical protein